jgi:hypothetical protein
MMNISTISSMCKLCHLVKHTLQGGE